MTCIVGLVHEDEVLLGADSVGVAGYSGTVRRDMKIYRREGVLLGFTSSYRMGQLLGYTLSVPKRHEDMDPYEFMVTEFIPRVRDCLKSGGWIYTDNGRDAGGTFLVGYARRLFQVSEDFQVGESLSDYSAVGCGAELAIGAMFATEGRSPMERIETALSAAEHGSVGVRRPFHILSTGDKAVRLR